MLYFATLLKVFQAKHNNLTAEDPNLRNTIKTLLIAAITLLPLFGLTWVFGLLAVNEDTVAFAWIFTILNSLQGLFIFIFYIMRNEKLRQILKRFIQDTTASVTFSTSDKFGTLKTSTARSRARNWSRSEEIPSGRRSTADSLTRSEDVLSWRTDSHVDVSWQHRSDSHVESTPAARNLTLRNPAVTSSLGDIQEEHGNN
ncbi:adhesion G protein-coupled receptor L2-like isoform X2 [Dysidea avara]|uniref:adhesion G protein-coupled receptor L2-like isoform X2 n=1 Tax=Dysidea avara TaxID=196820 RepID=UPI00331D8E60